MIFNHKMLQIFCVFILLIINIACSAKTDKTGIEKKDSVDKNCKVSFTSLKTFPGDVLEGTEIYKILTYKASSAGLDKNYYAEMGGAELGIKITKHKAQKIITRTFEEPGAPKKIREYSPVCQHNEFFSAGKLRGKIVNGGIIVLEEESNTGGIPADLWVYYRIDN